MEAIIYTIIFITGALFGSFCTLATYRIPRHQDITHTRSYCPNCNHKLGFFDMFPIISYIFLGGKCRYCKQKISPRYLALEVFSGASFLALFVFMRIDLLHINVYALCKFGFFALFLTYLFLTAWIDKENRKVEKGVSIFGIIISLIYIVYLCIVEKANIYKYAIYIGFYILVLILDTIVLRKFAKNKYINGLLLTLITMAIFTKEYIAYLTVTATCLSIAIYMLIIKLKNIKNKSLKSDKQISSTIPIAYFMCMSNLILLLYFYGAVYFKL
ncbi:MAG: prepilin peptidase [Clostridia bacterium]|nr:prepilin peptidase [Clostridia bacterium]